MTTKTAFTRRTALALGGAALATPFIAPGLRAATTHEVNMLNQDPDNARARMVFRSRVLAIDPGDTVKFVAADRGHNSQSIDGMIPDGVDGWRGRINEEIEVTFDTPGVYGYQCTPHVTLGMVGLIAVRGDGATANIEAAQGVRQRGRAQAIWSEIWDEVAALDLA